MPYPLNTPFAHGIVYVPGNYFLNTNQGNPSQRASCIFPSFGNVFSPLMAILNILRLIMGLSIWLFSTLNVPNAPKIFVPMKYIPPSSYFGESISPTNHNFIRNIKRKDKKKKQRQRDKSPTTTIHVRDKSSTTTSHSSYMSLVTVCHTGDKKPTIASHVRGKKQVILGALILLRNIDEQDTSISFLLQFVINITLHICALLL